MAKQRPSDTKKASFKFQRFVPTLSWNRASSCLRQAYVGLKKQCDDAREELQAAKKELVTLREATHDWYCGCGHWNGPNLEFCAMCGRTPGDKIVMKQH